jgi:hypothetical protein
MVTAGRKEWLFIESEEHMANVAMYSDYYDRSDRLVGVSRSLVRR